MSNALKQIAEKVFANQRISPEEGLLLYQEADLGFLGTLANYVRERLHGDKTYFNRNFHIEPTNICIYNCEFCSYKRNFGQEGAWEYNLQEMMEMVKTYDGQAITEVHIVGGVHPKRDLHYYGEILSAIKAHRPKLHIKAFTAVELEFMIKKAGFSIEEGLKKLKAYGLDSIPGGGAEIFDKEIREEVCGAKSTTDIWLEIHETAHKVGLPSNATILYGHIEKYEHRIDHMLRLRNLQDRTNGFNTYIPLKFRKENNHLSHLGEVSTEEDLRNYAVSRIFLDNIPHLKAYWPMIGKQTTQLALSFGVDDIDGTIDDSTKIYSMAGVEDQNPKLNTESLIKLIKDVKRIPIERDTVYNEIKVY
ncbi:MAG: aminofutalosine synthase MqnE [Bacteroidales bacterium]|nr:aminofutalosine synthase MqnE [Bacteroidales bacterium]